jgi:hypothetical protein
MHPLTMAATVIPGPPWRPTPGTTAYDNQPACVVSRLDMYRTKVLMYRTMVLLARLTKVRR